MFDESIERKQSIPSMPFPDLNAEKSLANTNTEEMKGLLCSDTSIINRKI